MEWTDQELRSLVRACWAPDLQPFAVLAADVGLDAAVEACETRCLPASVVLRFDQARWTIDHLPSREAIEELLLGIKVHARRRGPYGKRRPLYAIARDLGENPARCRRAEAAVMEVAGPIFRGKLRRA